MSSCYSTYGLTLHSELPLPELRVDSGQAEINIQLGKVPIHLPDAQLITPGYMANATATLVQLDTIGRCLAIEGHTLIVEPANGVDERSLRTYVLNTGLVALLQQRPVMVLQSSAIRWNDAAVLFAGIGAVGKSTLAALFADQGSSILTDEVAVITSDDKNRPVVQPGYPALKLWPDTLARLKSDWPAPHRLRPGIGKRIVCVPARFVPQAMPVAGIICLSSSSRSGIRIQSIKGTESMTTLTALADRLRGVPSARIRALRFLLTGALARLPVCHRVEWSPREESYEDLQAALRNLLIDLLPEAR